MNIYFMRHGQTDWNTIRRLQGTTDIPLNQQGIDEAKRTSAALHRENVKFDLIYTSPLVRAQRTAQEMNAYSCAAVKIDDRIREFCFGKAEGITLEQIKKDEKYKVLRAWFFDPENYHSDMGSESYEQFFGRIQSFLDELIQLEKTPDAPQNVLIVCHGGVVRGILKQMLDLDVKKFAQLSIPNCSINKAVLKDGTFTMEYTARVLC